MNKSKQTDFDIIEQIKQGDTAAFRYLVDKYKGVSFSLACSVLHNEHEAEDALQEAYIKAFKGLKRFRYQSGFATWFYKIVLNTCKSRYRTLQRRNDTTSVNSFADFDSPINNSGFQNLIEAEQKQLINKVIGQMKEDEALVLRLFYLAELSIKEIIEILGYSESKIKVTLHRARKSFQKKIEPVLGKEIVKP